MDHVLLLMVLMVLLWIGARVRVSQPVMLEVIRVVNVLLHLDCAVLEAVRLVQPGRLAAGWGGFGLAYLKGLSCGLGRRLGQWRRVCLRARCHGGEAVRVGSSRSL